MKGVSLKWMSENIQQGESTNFADEVKIVY